MTASFLLLAFYLVAFSWLRTGEGHVDVKLSKASLSRSRLGQRQSTVCAPTQASLGEVTIFWPLLLEFGLWLLWWKQKPRHS